MTQWHYKIVDLDDTAHRGTRAENIDALGLQGWELVAVRNEETVYFGNDETHAIAYFKRPV